MMIFNNRFSKLCPNERVYYYIDRNEVLQGSTNKYKMEELYKREFKVNIADIKACRYSKFRMFDHHLHNDEWLG